jgi:ABC-type transporter Mla subunit MlaD
VLVPDPHLARRIGALTLLAMGGVVAGFVFLGGRAALGPVIRFRVVFHQAAGLHADAPLVVAGRAVGRVAAISPLPHGAPGPLDGDVGVVASVELARDRQWTVPAAATIFVASRGALSDRYLEVAPPAGDPGPPIADGAELRGIDPPSLDNVLQHTWNNLAIYRQFVDTVRPELAALRTQLGQLRAAASPGPTGELLDAARGLVSAAERTGGTALGGTPGVAHLLATIAAAQGTAAEIRAALDLLGPELAAATTSLGRIRGHLAATDPLARAESILATVHAALDKLDPLLATAGDIAQRFAAGEGTIGRILKDPEFPEDTKDLGKMMKRQPWKILQRPPD